MQRKNNSKKDIAYELLKQVIISGDFLPGEIYTIDEFSRKIGVSKTPTREALVVLSSQRFIETIPRSGYRIIPFTIRDVIDIFHLRSILEVEAVTLAIDRITERDIAILEKNNQEERKLSLHNANNNSNHSYRRGYELNKEFHLTIARASGNIRIVRLLDQLLVEVEKILAQDPSIADEHQHIGILESIKNKDKPAAQKAMKNHLEETKCRLLERFQGEAGDWVNNT